jgi:predicted Zn-dependent protease
MRRFKLLIPLTFLALVSVSCATSPTGRGQMIWKSDAELEAQSARAFNQMRAGMPLSTDRKKIDFVACVAEGVVAVLEPPHNDIEWELAVFDSESVNAFAMPGGKIGVFTGILEVAENQHQLAAVIGHEIAHVTARHSNERASRASLTNVGIDVVAIILGGGSRGATYTAQQALGAGAAFGISLPHTRGQESEADIIGLEYMAKAGFDPRESVTLWQRMDASTDKKPAEFVSTHPSSESRIEALVSQWPKTLPLYNEAIEEGRVPTCTK